MLVRYKDQKTGAKYPKNKQFGQTGVGCRARLTELKKMQRLLYPSAGFHR